MPSKGPRLRTPVVMGHVLNRKRTHLDRHSYSKTVPFSPPRSIHLNDHLPLMVLLAVLFTILRFQDLSYDFGLKVIRDTRSHQNANFRCIVFDQQ